MIKVEIDMIEVEIDTSAEIYAMIEHLKIRTDKDGSLCAKFKDSEDINYKWVIEWCPNEFTKHSVECSSIDEGIRHLYKLA